MWGHPLSRMTHIFIRLPWELRFNTQLCEWERRGDQGETVVMSWVKMAGSWETIAHSGTALELEVPGAWGGVRSVASLCKLKRWPRKVAWAKWRDSGLEGLQGEQSVLRSVFHSLNFVTFILYKVKVEIWPLLESSLGWASQTWFFTLPYLYNLILGKGPCWVATRWQPIVPGRVSFSPCGMCSEFIGKRLCGRMYPTGYMKWNSVCAFDIHLI